MRADSKMYLDNCCDLIYEEGSCLFATWRGRQRRNRVFASCERRQYLTQPVLLRQPTEFSLCELDPSRAFASFVSPSTLFSSKAMFPKICWPTVSQFCSVTVLCFGWCNSNIWPDSQKWISPTDRLKKTKLFLNQNSLRKVLDSAIPQCFSALDKHLECAYCLGPYFLVNTLFSLIS